MNVHQTALSVVTLGLFSKELWRFDWRARWVLSPKHLHYGRAQPRLVGCKLSCLLLLVLEMECQAWEEVLEKTFHQWIASLAYFSVYPGTMWAFCEYISPKFSIICLIQLEDRFIILFNTFQVRTSILKNWTD